MQVLYIYCDFHSSLPTASDTSIIISKQYNETPNRKDIWQVQFPLSHDSCRQPQTYVKPEAAITVFELLMMSGVSLETCWAIKKQWNNKFYYTVASGWLFL